MKNYGISTIGRGILLMVFVASMAIYGCGGKGGDPKPKQPDQAKIATITYDITSKEIKNADGTFSPIQLTHCDSVSFFAFEINNVCQEWDSACTPGGASGTYQFDPSTNHLVVTLSGETLFQGTVSDLTSDSFTLTEAGVRLTLKNYLLK